MNYLEKVKEFRRATGLDAGQSEELHDKLIREELSELADALADSVVVWCGKCADGYISEEHLKHEIANLDGAATLKGVDLDAAFKIVDRSNMSKLCTTQEIMATSLKYMDIGVITEFDLVSDDLYACRSGCDHPDYPRGKLLKSVEYRGPDWSGDEWLL